jgi:hypothetical protein
MNTLAASPVATAVPSLTRLLSRVLELAIVDQRTTTSLVQDTFQALSTAIARVARDWESGPLNHVHTDESIGEAICLSVYSSSTDGILSKQF